MTDLDLLMEKLRQHLFGSGEFTKDDLYRLYDVCANLYTEDDIDLAFERGYDEGLEDGREAAESAHMIREEECKDQGYAEAIQEMKDFVDARYTGAQ